jgi:hypothetical protein
VRSRIHGAMVNECGCAVVFGPCRGALRDGVEYDRLRLQVALPLLRVGGPWLVGAAAHVGSRLDSSARHSSG